MPLVRLIVQPVEAYAGQVWRTGARGASVRKVRQSDRVAIGCDIGFAATTSGSAQDRRSWNLSDSNETDREA